MRQKATKRIALLLGQDLGYSRRVLSGVLNYSESQQLSWVYHNAPPDIRILPALKRWRPDGIIVHLSDRSLAEQLMEFSVPIVSVTDTVSGLSIPQVDVDSEAVGQMAAEYLANLGLRYFAYYGSSRVSFSQKRESGFRKHLESLGHPVANLHADFLPYPPFQQDWNRMDRQTERWLQRLPKPVGILASNDIPARTLCEICRNRGLRVPDDVAILGVDNDVSECRMSFPALSSVEIPAEAIGRKATEVLEGLLLGTSQDVIRHRLPPIGVMPRSSTDRFSSESDAIQRALHYIDQTVEQGIEVSDVCRQVGHSRRSLERHFQKVLKTTIYQQIQKARVNRAKRLLMETELSISEIAERVGFGNLRRLDRVFGQFENCAPSAFRKLR